MKKTDRNQRVAKHACHFLGFIAPSIQHARMPDTEESRGVR